MEHKCDLEKCDKQAIYQLEKAYIYDPKTGNTIAIKFGTKALRACMSHKGDAERDIVGLIVEREPAYADRSIEVYMKMIA